MASRASPQTWNETRSPSRTEPPVPRRSLLAPALATLASGLSVLVACGADDDAQSNAGGTAGTSGQGRAGSSGKAGSTGGASLGGRGGGAPGDGAGLAGEAGQGGAGAVASDAEPLDVLLGAEYVVIAAYTAAAEIIELARSDDARFASKDVLLALVLEIRSHHQLQAQAVLDAIHALDGTPTRVSDAVAAYALPSVLKGNPTIENALKYLAGLEKSAAVRYEQLLTELEDPSLRYLVASIAGVEAEHFVVLAVLALSLLELGASAGHETAGKLVPQAFVA